MLHLNNGAGQGEKEGRRGEKKRTEQDDTHVFFSNKNEKSHLSVLLKKLRDKLAIRFEQ